jgi:hypothetical protein
MKGPTTERRNPHSIPLLMFLLLAVMVFAILAAVSKGATPSRGREDENPAGGEATTLMLVRDWDPENSILIGWLPSHSVEMDLQLITDPKGVHFELDEAVTIHWLRRREQDPQSGRMLVSPAPHIFQGASWLPVDRDANVVRVRKEHFLIRSIVFGVSPWRQSSRPARSEKVANNSGEVH